MNTRVYERVFPSFPYTYGQIIFTFDTYDTYSALFEPQQLTKTKNTKKDEPEGTTVRTMKKKKTNTRINGKTCNEKSIELKAREKTLQTKKEHIKTKK